MTADFIGRGWGFPLRVGPTGGIGMVDREQEIQEAIRLVLGTAPGESKGDFDGWFCPCHGSHYDTAARVRKGPAPKNLVVPEYAFKSDTVVQIG